MADQLPPRRFEFGSTIKVSTDVHPSGEAVIAGAEWGPDNNKTLTVRDRTGWVYFLRFPGATSMDSAWRASESELLAWNQNGKG